MVYIYIGLNPRLCLPGPDTGNSGHSGSVAIPGHCDVCLYCTTLPQLGQILIYTTNILMYTFLLHLLITNQVSCDNSQYRVTNIEQYKVLV